MAKRTTTFELMLPGRDAETPAHRWLYSALRAEILEGRLRPSARLPGTRDLAKQYRLSRGTIVNAFEKLKSEGCTAGWLCDGINAASVTTVVATRNVEVTPLSRYSRGRMA